MGPVASCFSPHWNYLLDGGPDCRHGFSSGQRASGPAAYLHVPLCPGLARLLSYLAQTPTWQSLSHTSARVLGLQEPMCANEEDLCSEMGGLTTAFIAEDVKVPVCTWGRPAHLVERSRTGHTRPPGAVFTIPCGSWVTATKSSVKFICSHPPCSVVARSR